MHTKKAITCFSAAAVLSLCMLVPAILEASAAIAGESAVKSYTGPVLPANVAVPAPKEPTVVEALEAWFAGEIREGSATITGTLRSIDPNVYNASLTQRRERAQACVDRLPPDLAQLLAAFRSAPDAAAQASAIHALAQAAVGKPAETLGCLDAAALRLGDRGVLLSGLVFGTAGGAVQLKPMVLSRGQVFILRPEVLTAWPGRADSALRALDPRDGPWNVLLAQTYEESVTEHGPVLEEKWGEVSVREYAGQRRNGHYLLVDGSGAALGWLDMDRAAFFDEDSEQTAAAWKKSFTDGVAAFLHGVWWNPKGYRDDSRGAGPNLQDVVFIHDLFTMIEGKTETTSASYKDPYPESMEFRKLRSLKRETKEYGSHKAIFVRLQGKKYENEIWKYSNEPVIIRYDPMPGATAFDPSRLLLERRSTTLTRTTVERIWKPVPKGR